MIQNRGIDEFGDVGGGLGYHALPNSLAVEFDTFWNSEHDPLPVGQHVAVHSGGTAANNAGAAPLGSAQLPPIQDGNAHAVRIVYAPGTLSVFVDDLTTPLLTVAGGPRGPARARRRHRLRRLHRRHRGRQRGPQHPELAPLLGSPAGTLRVVTQVVNDDGGAKQPGDFSVHVRSARRRRAGQPAPRQRRRRIHARARDVRA